MSRSTRTQDTWPANRSFTADSAVAIAIASYGGGTGVKIYGVNAHAEFEAFDGLWYHMSAAAPPSSCWTTPPTVTDALTASDSQDPEVALAGLRASPAAPPSRDSDGGKLRRNFTFNDNGGSPDTITTGAGDFTTEGFEVGMTLTVAGTSSNNGTYTLTVVAAQSLSVATGSFAAEGPLSGAETLDAAASLSDPS